MWRWAVWTLCFSAVAVSGAPATEYDATGGRLRARDASGVIWENVHVRDDGGRPAGEPGRLTPPVAIGDALFYAVGNQLYAVSAADGAVRARVPLPAGATAVRAEDGVLVVTVGEDSSGQAWRRDYRVDPARPEVPFFLSTRVEVLSLRRAAQRVLPDLLESAAAPADAGAEAPADAGAEAPADGADPDDPAWRRSAAARPWLESAIAELEVLAAWDPTNPWYGLQRGLYLEDLGRGDEAREVFEAVLEVEEPWSGELLGMALALDAIDPALGERAFERGLSYMVRRGYDPGMTHTLIPVLLHYGRPDPDRPGDAARLEQLASRIWRLAPEVEGAPYFYAAVADALEADGAAERASLWRERAYAGLPTAGFIPGGHAVEGASLALNGLLAGLLALALMTFVKGLRYLPTQRRAGRSGWNPLSLWTRGELLGALVVLGLLFYSSSITARGLSAIGRAAALPIAAGAGNYGHPAAVEHLSGLEPTPGGAFVHALALQKAGRLDEARTLYERLDDPRALNNLGALQQARGEAAGARALFERAADVDPDLAVAALNAGRASEAPPRIETLRRYGAPGPWLALPSDAQWDEALAASHSPFQGLDRFFDAFQTIGVIASAAPAPLARADLLDPGVVALGLTLLVAGLALLGLFLRPGTPPVSTRVSRAGWGLGFVVPGTARQLGMAGPILLWVAGYSWLVDRSLALSDGVGSNIMTAIATPSFDRAFGASTLIHPPLEQAVRSTADWWWMLAIANLVVVLALEWWRPDPCGPRGTPSE